MHITYCLRWGICVRLYIAHKWLHLLYFAPIKAWAHSMQPRDRDEDDHGDHAEESKLEEKKENKSNSSNESTIQFCGFLLHNWKCARQLNPNHISHMNLCAPFFLRISWFKNLKRFWLRQKRMPSNFSVIRALSPSLWFPSGDFSTHNSWILAPYKLFQCEMTWIYSIQKKIRLEKLAIR